MINQTFTVNTFLESQSLDVINDHFVQKLRNWSYFFTHKRLTERTSFQLYLSIYLDNVSDWLLLTEWNV